MEIYVVDTKEKLNALDVTNMWQNILQSILRKKFPKIEVVIEKDKKGKPFIANIPECHFSISHSNMMIAIAVDDFPIGIDVEWIRDIDLKVVERFFSSRDIENFSKVEKHLRREYFFEMWTQKESYVKCIGIGFSGMPFRKFTIEDNKLVGDSSGRYSFVTYDICGEYKMSVCTSSHTDENFLFR